ADETGTKANQVQADLTSLEGWINEVNTDPTQSYPSLTLPSLSYGSPQLNFQFSLSPAWGGTGGSSFTDITDQSIRNAFILSSLVIWGGSRLDNLNCTYGSVTSEDPITVKHGGGGGGASVPLSLQKGEFITEIAGTYGDDSNSGDDVVHQLTFKTSKGQTLT